MDTKTLCTVVQRRLECLQVVLELKGTEITDGWLDQEAHGLHKRSQRSVGREPGSYYLVFPRERHRGRNFVIVTSA